MSRFDVRWGAPRISGALARDILTALQSIGCHAEAEAWREACTRAGLGADLMHLRRGATVRESRPVSARDPREPLPLSPAERDAFATQARAAVSMARGVGL